MRSFRKATEDASAVAVETGRSVSSSAASALVAVLIAVLAVMAVVVVVAVRQN